MPSGSSAVPANSTPDSNVSPGRGAHQRLGQIGLDAETLCPPGGFGSEPGVVAGQAGVPVTVVDPTAGNTVHAGGELPPAPDGRVAAHQEQATARLSADRGDVTHQHHGGRRPHDPAVQVHPSAPPVSSAAARRAKYRPSMVSTAMDCRKASERVSAVSIGQQAGRDHLPLGQHQAMAETRAGSPRRDG